MNDTTTDLDQADEDILSYTVSDEALEAAAGTERDTATYYITTHHNNPTPYCC